MVLPPERYGHVLILKIAPLEPGENLIFGRGQNIWYQFVYGTKQMVVVSFSNIF